jgi:hypothetical protein
MQCKIFGFFWYGRAGFLSSFWGEVEVGEGGSVEGTIEDEWGVANITGEMKETFLKFTKRYIRTKCQTPDPNPIRYHFSRQSKDHRKSHPQEEWPEENWRGGFKQTGSGHESEDPYRGKAVCAIHPL